MMPGMNGFELAEHLRSDDTTRLVPIIFVTALHPDEQHLFSGYEAGGVDYIVKPYNPQILLAKVRIFLELDRQRQELQWQRDNLELLVAERTCELEQELSERKRAEAEKTVLEQQLHQAQKLESLGVLAGGIAHDFNNILAIITGYCGLVKINYETAEKNIPHIEKAAERAAELCRQMLAYAGKAPFIQAEVDFSGLVDEMITMLKATISQNVVIKSVLSRDFPFFMGDSSQLRQVVMNLIINAAEAIGEVTGEIGISLEKTEIKAGQTEIDHLGTIIPEGRYICFEVTDNGCGMDAETRRKIFEPFYSTKFAGRGLGMSAVLGIIKAHDGALQLESRVGHGTTFKVYLPVQVGSSEKEEASQNATSVPWQGSGTILLAEDEEHVKSIAVELIQMLGFTVIVAANGKEALELYEKSAADITMVVTDIGMPVMNGYELFYELKQRSQQLPIIISSGFGEGYIVSKIPREEIAGLINKPYSFDQLRDVLRGVVERVSDE
jgi:signal transduction histidine kinase